MKPTKCFLNHGKVQRQQPCAIRISMPKRALLSYELELRREHLALSPSLNYQRRQIHMDVFAFLVYV